MHCESIEPESVKQLSSDRLAQYCMKLLSFLHETAAFYIEQITLLFHRIRLGHTNKVHSFWSPPAFKRPPLLAF